MKRSIYKNFEELPLFLNAEIVAKTLGVSPSTAYELMHEKGFPSLRIGSRIVVPKEKFQQWVEEQMGGAKGRRAGRSVTQSKTISLCPMRSINWACPREPLRSTDICSALKTVPPTSAIPATAPLAVRWG